MQQVQSFKYSQFIKRSITISFFALLVLGLSGCKPEIKKASFFDLSGYFTKEAARLQALNKPVLKTVEHNGTSETKRIAIRDWNAELSLFKNSDINKPAWASSYAITADSNITIYRSKDPDLKIGEVMIKQEKGKVKWIVILNHNKNLLYETMEKLSYFPDSLYMIEKRQSVRILGTNRYRIKGLFNQ